MARGKGKSGLDALFNKVFDDVTIKDAISSLHEDFGSEPSPSPPPQPSTSPVLAKVLHEQPNNNQDKESTNHPTSTATKRPANQPANNQANTQANKPDSEPIYNPVKSTNEPDNKPAKPDYPDNHPTNKPVHDPVNNPVTWPHTEPANKPVIKPVNVPTKQPAQSSNIIIDPELWYPYTEKQGKILLYLIQAGGRTKREHISRDTGINIATVKYSLRILVKDGYISRTELDVNHTDRGFTYHLNPQLCNEYATRILGAGYKPINEPASHRGNYPAIYPDNNPHTYPVHYPDNVATSQAANPFSSSLDNKLTTKEPSVKNKILCGALEAYWVEEGLREQQVLKWCADFEIEPSTMKYQLEWARFDLENNNKRGDVKKGVVNWFFGCLAKTGGSYPRPVNYKSAAELRAEALELELAKEMEAKERLAAAEIESDFRQILMNPGGETYQTLLTNLNEFARSMTGEALEAVLREEFLKSRGGVTRKDGIEAFNRDLQH